MADTLQTVQWALGQQCPIRPGPNWENPATALEALAECRTFSKQRTEVFGDVCVTAFTSAIPGKYPAGFDAQTNVLLERFGRLTHYHYPAGGFVLSSQFSSMGGLPSLHRLCGDCPANGDAGGIAGCAGTFYQRASSDLQEQIERLVDRLALASKLDAVFPSIRIHWFRFWINSPIPTEALNALLILLEAIYEEDRMEIIKAGRSEPPQQIDLKTFVLAVERALKTNIPLHVTLSPPGHVDMGWHTIFPHCPRCKAEAPVKRWRRKYRDENVQCAICGATYSPAKTQSAVRWEPRDDIRALLGQAEFEKLAVRYLVAQAVTEQDAIELVRVHEEWESRRRVELAKRREEGRRHHRYVETVIYRGITNLSRGGDNELPWLFSASDMEEISRRCEEVGGVVLVINHISESGDLDEFVDVKRLGSFSAALGYLRDKGCNEMFSVDVRIPKEIVESWANCLDEHGDSGGTVK